MAFAHGKHGGFSIEDSSTTVRNIGPYLTSVTMPRTADTAETTTFNTTGDAKTYVAGNKDGTLSLEGIWDPTVDGYLDGILGSIKGWIYYPVSTAAGSIKYSGDGILTSYEPPTSIDEAVTFSAEIQVTGIITRGTV